MPPKATGAKRNVSILTLTITGVDMDAFQKENGVKVARTEATYNKKIRVYRQFLEKPEGQALEDDDFCEDNMEKFLATVATTYNFHPSAKKTYIAALNKELLMRRLGNLHDANRYPSMAILLERWRSHNKEHPIFTKHASHWETDAIQSILELDPATIQEMQDQAAEVMKIFTGYRSEDCHGLNSSGVTFAPQTKKDPRSFKLSMVQTKNDREGNGPQEGRTNFVTCMCVTWTTDPKEKAQLARAIDRDPLHPCTTACPFEVVFRYRESLPDKDGSAFEEKQAQLEANGALRKAPVKFFRSIISGKKIGSRFSATENKGISYFSDASKRIETRIPENQRPGTRAGREVTGHSGRHTHSTLAFRAGADSGDIMQATHHQSIEMLQRNYVHPTDTTMQRSGIAIAQLMQSNADDTMVGGIDVNAIESSSSSSSSSSSASALSPTRTTQAATRHSPRLATNPVRSGSGNVYNITFH